MQRADVLIRYDDTGFERRYRIVFGAVGIALVGAAVAWLWLMEQLPPGGIIGALAIPPALLGILALRRAWNGP